MQNKFPLPGVPATKSGIANGSLAAPENGIVAVPDHPIGNRIAIGNANGIAVRQQSSTGRIIAKRSGAMAVGAGKDVGQRIASADTIAPGRDAWNIIVSAVMNVRAAPKTTKLRTAALIAGLIITDVPAIRGSENIVIRAVLAVRAIAISAGEQHRLATTVVKTMLVKQRQPAVPNTNHAAAVAPATAACIVLTLTAEPVWQRFAALEENSALAMS